MNRDTIDFGIDLGTTNSVVSVLNGVTPEVVKNNIDMEINPSAVHINKQQSVQTGLRAKSKMESDAAADDVHVEFKRRMGSDFMYEFASSGLERSPEQLSAEVLMSLKADVLRQKGEEIQAAVITIPAAFEQRQCAATKRAGELAGFRQTALLQEPVAASLAYGFQKDASEKSFWMTFDFGGGTFDAAIMKVEDGDIQVVNHGGDNYLGGVDLDWAIIEKLVIPELIANYNLPDLKRGNAKYRSILAKIKRAVEEAKIHLTVSESECFDNCEFEDECGELVDLSEIKLTRNQVVQLAEPLIVRASNICLRVLKEKGIDPSAMEKVILVGGPTKAPYFRDVLSSHLGIPLDFSMDPMTVVSQGAAVFAGTQRLKETTKSKPQAGQFTVTLNYNPIGPDEDPRVTGEVASYEGNSVENYTVELLNQANGWSSGKLTLKEEGRFSTRLLAKPNEKNVFEIILCNPTGSKQVCMPSEFGYTMGVTIKEQICVNDILLEKAGNEIVLMVERGSPYPFQKKGDFITTIPLRKGTEDKLIIPVLESKQPINKADHCVKMGELIINGRQVRRDVPVGTEIEVELSAKEPGHVCVKAYIGLLDEEFEAQVRYEETSPDPKDLDERLSKMKEDLSALEDASFDDQETVIEQLHVLIHETSEKLQASGDVDALRQAQDRVIELRKKLDDIASKREWPERVEEAQVLLEKTDELVRKSSNPVLQEKAKGLRNRVEEYIVKHDIQGLNRSLEKIKEFYYSLLFEQSDFLKGYLAYLYQKRFQMENQTLANRLFNEGAALMEKEDVSGIRRIISQLLNLLPEDVQEEIQRGYGSGITQ